jgi:thiamine-phosphate diphosphorylase
LGNVLDSLELRRRLGAARLYLVFTPEIVTSGDPLAVLEAALPHVDLVQVRPKPPETGLDPLKPAFKPAVSDARAVHEWTLKVLELCERLRSEALVLVNDRVDVARGLLERGVAGVHIGQDDTPPRIARELLGTSALVGLSTHTPAQVVAALDEPVDYLGFGPVRATATKGYERGLGTEKAWIASLAATVPVFPIGGIGLSEAADLAEVGRSAVSSAILNASDPAAAALALRSALCG